MFSKWMHSTLTQILCSGFNSRTPFQGTSGFSLRQTEPTQGQYSGLSWNGKGEGLQYSHRDSTSQGHISNGFSDSSLYFPVAQMHSQRNQWSSDLSPSGQEASAMSRFPSQDSTGAQSQRTTQSSSTDINDQNRSLRLYPNVSNGPYNGSSIPSDATVRSASPSSSVLYTPSGQIDFQSAFDNFTYPGHDDMPGNDFTATTTGYSQPPTLSLTTEFDMFPIADGLPTSLSAAPRSLTSYVQSAPDSVIYNSALIGSPTNIWGNSFLESQRSSPVVHEEPWSLPPQMMSSTVNSPLDYSPIDGNSPRMTRKPNGPRPSKVAGDIANARQPGNSEDSFKLVGRSSLEADNSARDHELYHNVTTGADGLYHCPWEGNPNCQHKPEKLKCNYDKFVDSHLKPYRCKIPACADNKFSSTACLLRHEREAHAMHGHGDKPFLCKYEGCERGVAGNGFPRRWNLYDHMKRVHNDQTTSKDVRSNGSASPPPTEKSESGSKKRKQDAIEDQASPEKEAKRVKSPIVNHEPSLVERYHQSEQKLLEAVKQLHDPKNANTMTILRNASDCLKIMAQTTQRINAAPGMNRTLSQGSMG
ncbi:c2h2 transcription factor protein [Rutstroemia sp. NJR-2017a BVV2]|nr:c2h2 transcription factor protein [Rutstroemia sp. NJR-2017a BVV2]